MLLPPHPDMQASRWVDASIWIVKQAQAGKHTGGLQEEIAGAPWHRDLLAAEGSQRSCRGRKHVGYVKHTGGCKHVGSNIREVASKRVAYKVTLRS